MSNFERESNGFHFEHNAVLPRAVNVACPIEDVGLDCCEQKEMDGLNNEMDTRVTKDELTCESDSGRSGAPTDINGRLCSLDNAACICEVIPCNFASCAANNINSHTFDFNFLPHVVMVGIVSFLDIKDRGRVACVCRKWHEICNDPSLWRTLNLSGRRLVTDDILDRLTSLSDSVLELDVSECASFSDNGLQTALQKCSALQILRTVRSPCMTDKCLSTVGQICRNLRIVHLSMCSITDKGMEMLCQGCPEIQEMKLNQCPFITSAALFHISKYCPNIDHLSLEHNIKILDDGVKELVSRCRRLKRLQLNSCGISGEGAKSIASYSRHMTILDIRYCTTLNDDIVKEIVCGCPNLVILNLSLCFNVTDKSAGHIVQHCTKLSSLYLVHCRISDEGLVLLSVNAFGLERLDVSWCQEITDEGVKVLVHGCKTLKHLGLVRCDQVTNETITELNISYPHVFLSTFVTEVNRMFKNGGIYSGAPREANQ